jgi:hypothetical protein
VASWLIFGVAHSLRIDLDMLVVRALKINQLTDGGMPQSLALVLQARGAVFKPFSSGNHPDSI